MSFFSRSTGCIAITTILLAACRGTGPDAVEPCSGPIQLGLRYEPPLAFDWSPHCGITSLSVTALPATTGESERLAWAFNVPENAPLGPFVRYGEAPSRATVWRDPEPLVSGRHYRVSVLTLLGGDVVTASGELSFRWFQPD